MKIKLTSVYVVDPAQRAEHPVRHGAQMGPVLLESLGQVIGLVHRSHFPVGFRHGSNRGCAANDIKENR